MSKPLLDSEAKALNVIGANESWRSCDLVVLLPLRDAGLVELRVTSAGADALREWRLSKVATDSQCSYCHQPIGGGSCQRKHP